MRRRYFYATLLWGLQMAILATAEAQPVAEASSTQPSGPTSSLAVTAKAADCELHVWPAAGMRSMFFGWFHGSTVDGSEKKREGYPTLPADPLAPSVQVRTLASLPLSAKLNLPDGEIIVHDPLADRRAILSVTGRRAESSSPCYAELLVDDIFYEYAALSGSSLSVLFRFRDFGGDNSPKRSFASWAKASLHAFPPAKPADNDAAIAELVAAFGADFDIYSWNMTAPRGKKR